MNDESGETHARRLLRALDENPDLFPDQIADKTGLSRASLNRMKASLKLQPKIRGRIESGELISVADVGYAVGLPTYLNTRHRRKGAPAGRVFSKGDYWSDVILPLQRYFDRWTEFPHLAPKEAQRRLDTIANIEQQLAVVKRDLEQRAVRASLSFNRRSK